MTELFVVNLTIIRQRWFNLAELLLKTSFRSLKASLINSNEQIICVNGIQLSSRHDLIAEPKLFIITLATDTACATVYGVGMGDISTLLSEGSNFNAIDIYVLNLALFALFLSYTDQSQWLRYPRLQLRYADTTSPTLATYIATTPDLLLSDNKNASLRDLLIFENNCEYSNKQHLSSNLDFVKRIKSNKQALNRAPGAASLRLIQNQPNAYIISTDPTLEDHYKFLAKERQKSINKRPLFIAVDTALTPLIYQDIEPDTVINNEKKITPSHLPKLVSDSIILVYFPSIPNEVIEFLPRPKYNAYSNSTKHDELNKQLHKLSLFTSGSVIHPAIDLTITLGKSNITLFGCDFSYPNKKTHAYWANDELGSYTNNAKHLILNGNDERVQTNLNFIAYLISLEYYIRSKSNISFHQSSLKGAKLAVPIIGSVSYD